jgi:uncharacterized coiled-coil protein SlyX
VGTVVADHFRINELLSQLAALTRERDHYGEQCVALNTQLAQAIAPPSKATLQTMLDEANKSARLIDNHRNALAADCHGAALRIDELERFKEHAANTATHLNQKVVERDRHMAQSQAEIAQLKRDNEELVRRLGNVLPGTRYTEPQVQDIKARLTLEYDGKLKTKQDEVERHIAEIGKHRDEITRLGGRAHEQSHKRRRDKPTSRLYPTTKGTSRAGNE